MVDGTISRERNNYCARPVVNNTNVIKQPVVKNIDVIKQARTWIDTPVKNSGATRSGCSCLGLFAGVAKELGLYELWENFAPYQGHYKTDTQRFMLRALRRFLIPHPRTEKPKPGWIALTQEDEYPSHVVLITGQGTIIEAGKWKVCEVDARRRPNIIEYYELPGVDYT